LSEELNYIIPGSKVGPYRVVRGFKGRGGMARVFEVKVRAKYRQPDRPAERSRRSLPPRLALKVAKEDCQAALVAEADFLRRFDHPNVVRIFPLAGYHRPVYAARERFPFGWGWYYTMELLGGGSLERYMTRPTTGLLRSPPGGGRRLSLLKTLGIVRQVVTALEHIHERNVINLDVKPGNVLFRQRQLRHLRGSVPQAVLCDFGISRDLRYPRAGMLGVATPEYVSPEQASELGRRPQRLDARSDVFSLGVMIYEMLTDELPFENIALAADPTYAPTPLCQLLPSAPRLLEEVVMRAMAKDPDYRFQTASEMRAALEQVRMPPDWGVIARYALAGAALAACLGTGGVGGWKIKNWLTTPTPTSTPTSAPTVEKTTPPPTITPTTHASTISPTDARPTSTPAPTPTPTNTPRPPAPTSSGG